jgi:alpha-L-fucosidase 2
MTKPLIMKYAAPAPDHDAGWENFSLPLGNGYMGANVFGIVERERIQITENSLENPGELGGLNNFAELYLKFDHADVQDYERGLCLDDATAYCRYSCEGVDYRREVFVSYPDRILVVRLTASRRGALSFKLCPEIPFIKDYAVKPGDGGGKSGTVTARGDTIVLAGRMHYYDILFEGRLQVLPTGGAITAHGGTLRVEHADSAVILFALGTNYRLSPHVFLENDPKRKLTPDDPGPRVAETLAKAAALGYEALRERHLADYRALFGRVHLELAGPRPDAPTDELLKRYGTGESLPYLEQLYFQYGRYLLISSSRPGALPANLQGVWNCHDQSPWGSGYWHNINVQMNYWPAFVTNLAETFSAYADFYEAFRLRAEALATDYIREQNPDNLDDRPGACGWTIGTAGYAYEITGPGDHSGPGTGGLTSKLFWDCYDFTRDPAVLRGLAYPALLSMARFLTKTVRDYGGRFLASFSASPEQMINGHWAPNGKYYQTIGCAFDQQMIRENGRDLLAAAAALGESDETVELQQRQIDRYDPVQIGWSGQIKEYEEENFYGEIGEYRHRHISQLMALHPGTLITRETPAWMDAAKVTLNERGDESTGWALAHRLNAWARTGDGNRSYKLLRELLGRRTLPNLWDTHPPFQIDGNFGGTAGIAEMLLQSHEGFVSVLPSLPEVWPEGRFSGLCARGGFVLAVDWKDGSANRIAVQSTRGGRIRLACAGIGSAAVEQADGNAVDAACESTGLIAFDTVPGGEYVITGLQPDTPVAAPRNLAVALPDLRLTWESEPGLAFNVYRAVDGAPVYETLAERLSAHEFQDRDVDFGAHEIVTYKVTACRADGGGESDGPVKTVNHATQLDLERYRHRVRQLNL